MALENDQNVEELDYDIQLVQSNFSNKIVEGNYFTFRKLLLAQ